MQASIVVHSIALLARRGTDSNQRSDLVSKLVLMRTIKANRWSGLSPSPIKMQRKSVCKTV